MMTRSELANAYPIKVAKYLLGKTIISIIDGQTTSGIIVETEAYLPENDQAAHNARGKTRANSSLYQTAGTLYVHPMRGHHLIDLVVGEEGIPGSVLIRAIKPITGIKVMTTRRGVTDIKSLCNGPGKLCKALGITKEIDGHNIFNSECPVRITDTDEIEVFDIIEGSRVGISKNTEAPLRFLVSGSKFTS